MATIRMDTRVTLLEKNINDLRANMKDAAKQNKLDHKAIEDKIDGLGDSFHAESKEVRGWIGRIENQMTETSVKLKGVLWLMGLGITLIVGSIHWDRIFGG